MTLQSMYRTNNKLGFTLIELSIFIVILSIILTTYIQSSTVKGISRGSPDTITKMKAISKMIAAHRKVNNTIPCPAPLNLAYSNPLFGQSVTSCSVSPPALIGLTSSNPIILRGAVPTYHLGLPKEYAVDEWGNKILYIVYNNAVSSTASYNAITTTDGITMSDANGIPIPAVDAGIYALVSTGKGANGAYPKHTITQNASTCTSTRDDEQNCKTTSTNHEIYVNSYKPNQFDDLVVWKTKAQVDAAAGISAPTVCASCLNYGLGTAVASDCSTHSLTSFRNYIIVNTAPCNYTSLRNWMNDPVWNGENIAACDVTTTNPWSSFSGALYNICKPCTSDSDCRDVMNRITHPSGNSQVTNVPFSTCRIISGGSGYCAFNLSHAQGCARLCSTP